MVEENPYDDSDEDSYTDDSPMSKPLRGTASRMGLEGSVPENEDVDDVTIEIKDPDGSVREYELSDRVKGYYEGYVDSAMENKEVYFYEYWWEGVELVVEYEGKVRDSSLRPGGNDSKKKGKKDQKRGRRRGMKSHNDYLPRNPRPPWSSRRGEPQVFVNIEDDQTEDVERFDEGMVPVHNITRLNIQERADKKPLQVEDLFIKAWDNDSEGQMPVNSDHADGEVEFEVDDFRDEMGKKDKTATGNQRGNRWNL